MWKFPCHDLPNAAQVFYGEWLKVTDIHENREVLLLVHQILHMRLLVEYLRWKFKLVPPELWSLRNASWIDNSFISVVCFNGNMNYRSNRFCKAEVHHQLATILMRLPSWRLTTTSGLLMIRNGTNTLGCNWSFRELGLETILWDSHSQRWDAVYVYIYIEVHYEDLYSITRSGAMGTPKIFAHMLVTDKASDVFVIIHIGMTLLDKGWRGIKLEISRKLQDMTKTTISLANTASTVFKRSEIIFIQGRYLWYSPTRGSSWTTLLVTEGRVKDLLVRFTTRIIEQLEDQNVNANKLTQLATNNHGQTGTVQERDA
ncbi:uncharacterized protein LOC113310576 isoform X1 [Papaver somniferum]|uniref:uncharacterized protein LOC113310576 isoform X1 n=1 Tax=Papaver somniferum TaxID=3469 RepID=UPI000E6FD7DD|nr:uncharacterized protein LOC113310576 isoform X1 [Papaver somniferum]